MQPCHRERCGGEACGVEEPGDVRSVALYDGDPEAEDLCRHPDWGDVLDERTARMDAAADSALEWLGALDAVAFGVDLEVDGSPFPDVEARAWSLVLL